MVRLLTLGFLLAVVGVPALADDTDPEPPACPTAELRKLQGTWKVTRVLQTPPSPRTPENWTYTFKSDKLLLKRGSRWQHTMAVKINTRKRPYTIVLHPDGEKEPPPVPYKIERGELYLGATPVTTRLDGKKGAVLVLSKHQQ